MRVALWNGSGIGNLGDALLDHINRVEIGKRIPGASFQTFTPWPSAALPHVKIDQDGRWSGEGLFDAIVIGGGALMIGPPFVHPSLQTCFLGPQPRRFRDLCPVIWNAVCFDGQFVQLLSEASRMYVRESAARVTYCSVRNRHSANLIRNCGATSDISITPDPVILLRPPKSRASRGQGHRRIGLALGLSGSSKTFLRNLTIPTDPSDWNSELRVEIPSGMLKEHASLQEWGKEDFVRRVLVATEKLARHADIEVCGFGGVYDDEATADALEEALNCHHIKFNDSVAVDALDWIASLDCLVASRLHACILALIVGTPFVALDPYYNPVTCTSRIREFMETVDLLDEYLPLQSFMCSSDALDEFVERSISRRSRLQVVHSSLSDLVRRHFDCVTEIIHDGRVR